MYQIYQVMPGESLFDISRKIKTSVEELEKLNGLKNGTNIDGSYIVIPNQDQVYYETYKVKKGDNIYSIAKKYGVDYDTLLSLNGINPNSYIYPDQEIIIPMGSKKVYVTKEGDTISKISDSLNKSVSSIMDGNKELELLPDQIIKY